MQKSRRQHGRRWFWLGLLTGLSLLALAAIPGSTDDPVVTRSYLDDSSVWKLLALDGETSEVRLRRSGEFSVVEVGEELSVSLPDGKSSFLRTGDMQEIDLSETGLESGQKYMWTGDEPVTVSFRGEGEVRFRRGKVE